MPRLEAADLSAALILSLVEMQYDMKLGFPFWTPQHGLVYTNHHPFGPASCIVSTREAPSNPPSVTFALPQNFKTDKSHFFSQFHAVYLGGLQVEMKSFPDGWVSHADRRFGTVTWSDAVVHEVKNVGETPSHAVRIELK